MLHQSELIGTRLAHSDDATQAEVLNAFVDVLTMICKPTTVEFFQEMIGSYDHLRQALPAEVTSLLKQRDALPLEIRQRQRENLDG